MKKILTLILAMSMIAAILAGCGGNKTPETTAPVTETTEAVTEETAEAATEEAAETETEEMTHVVSTSSAEALTMLETIWADYAEDEKFPIGGGDMDHFVMGAPGAYSEDAYESLNYLLLLPEEAIAALDGAATMTHGMNTNIFTSALVHMGDQTDLAELAATVKDSLQGNQWVCGAPETMLLAVINNEYLLISYGNAELMGIFQTHVEAVYPEAEILHTDAIFE